MQRTIKMAMVYPGLQLTIAWFLGTFAMGLVKKINPNSMEPFSLTGYLIEYGIFQAIALGIFAIVCAVCVILARKGIFKWVRGWVANTIWPIKTVARKFALARFFRSMSLLIGSGMNIRNCILNSSAMTVNPYIQRDLNQAAPFVADGATLVQAFSGCKTLTPVAREMIMVGEQSGNLEESLRKVSEYHLVEANDAVKKAMTVSGILVLLAVGALVGYIIISFYSNLYGNMLDGLV
jgi:type IV pilus assembly protein PilC